MNTKTVNIDDVRESLLYDLETSLAAFQHIWDDYFCYRDKPKEWAYKYHEIAARITAHKVLLTHVTDALLASYAIGSDHTTASMKALLSAATGELDA